MYGKSLKSKIILISIILMAICLVSPIAASDNATDGAELIDDIKVSFNETVYEKDLGYADVELPENTSGNLKATINNVEFYNENVSSSVKVPITIPKGAISFYVVNRDTDHSTYFLNFFFNGVEIQSNHTLKVMRVAPNYTISGFPEEILKDDPQGYLSLYFPSSANGEIKIYIDGEYAFNLTANHYTFLNASRFNTLALGSHNVTIVYIGDAYYKKFNRTFNFSVVDIIISVPRNMVFEHNDCLDVKAIKNLDGVVTVYVDNELVFKSKMDKSGELIHSMFKDMTCGEHVVEVQYNASKFSTSKRVNVNASYYVDIYDFGSFVYGKDSEIIITVPTDFKKKLIDISIDGKKYENFEIDNSGWIEIDVSKMDVGNHTLDFNFKGDEKYYPWSESRNFTLKYEILTPSEIFFDNGNTVSLELPSSAKGNLEVYIDGALYKSTKLAKGYAEIKIANLIPGKYNLTAKYTGDDFNVSEENTLIEIRPDIQYPYEIYVGEDKSIVVKTVKDAKGKVIFTIGDANYTVKIKNGKAALSLKNLKAGEYDDVEAKYVGDNGYNTTLYAFIDIIPTKIALKNLKVSSEKVQMKVYINGKLAKNTFVTFKVDKTTKKVKTDKNGIVTFNLAAGKHTIKATYKSAKTAKTVSVHVISLKSASVKKSAKKLVLTATLKKGKTVLKNKKVTFKFNGKTYKAKTDKNGVAKVTIKSGVLKKLDVGSKVAYQCSYLKDTVKKTAVVKK